MKEFSAWLEAANLPAELMMPASEGAETLVPPRTNHLWRLPSNRLVSRTQTPVLGFASNEKSGVPRKSPTISAMRSWKCGRASTWLGPPPASCQVFSSRNVPEFGSREMVVPPAETTFGEALGHTAPGLSPEDRSEEHTSELQSQSNLVCRLLLEKKKESSTELELILRRYLTS